MRRLESWTPHAGDLVVVVVAASWSAVQYVLHVNVGIVLGEDLARPAPVLHGVLVAVQCALFLVRRYAPTTSAAAGVSLMLGTQALSLAPRPSDLLVLVTLLTAGWRSTVPRLVALVAGTVVGIVGVVTFADSVRRNLGDDWTERTSMTGVLVAVVVVAPVSCGLLVRRVAGVPAVARVGSAQPRVVTSNMPVADRSGLSARELDVLRLVADGLTNAEIADRLSISLETVKSHVRRALEKTGARNRTHLAVLATRPLLPNAAPVDPSIE
ncbi:MAG: response regulator transcription factor [Dermatophilaceae bacterium]